MVFASLSLIQGLQISVSCLEQGILFAILTLEHGRGDYFAARIALQTNVVAIPTRVPVHVHSNRPFQIKVNLVSRFSVWNRVSILTILSGTG